MVCKAWLSWGKTISCLSKHALLLYATTNTATISGVSSQVSNIGLPQRESEKQMPSTGQERWLVFAGIAAAWIASIAFIRTGVMLLETTSFVGQWSPFRALSFALLCASLPLVAGIGWAARSRHFKSNIDGSAPMPGSPLDLILRFITNTVEQLILFCIACLGAATFAPTLSIKLLPVMGCWFIVARAAFFAGYRFHPLARAFGFASTFHPSVALIGFAVVCALH